MPVSCARCSRQSPDGTAFCLACGSPIQQARPTQQPAQGQQAWAQAPTHPAAPNPYAAAPGYGAPRAPSQGAPYPGGAPQQRPPAYGQPAAAQPRPATPGYGPAGAAPGYGPAAAPGYGAPAAHPAPQVGYNAPAYGQPAPVYGQPAPGGQVGYGQRPVARTPPRGGLSLGCGVAILVAVLGVLGSGALLIYVLIHKVDDEARSGPSASAPSHGSDGPSPGGPLASRVEREVGPYKLEKIARTPDVPAEIDAVTIEYRGEGVRIEHTLIAAASAAKAEEAVRSMLGKLRAKYPGAEVQEGAIQDARKTKTGYMVRAVVENEELFFWCRDTLVAVAEGPIGNTRRFVGALGYGAS